jgi:hypothetical protein
MPDPNRIAHFAETDYRSRKIKFGIKERDRLRHMYIIGKTGMGKSTLLENLAIQDILNGNGVGFIDPHGSSAEELLNYIPKDRVKDVIYFAPFDQEHPLAFNVMEDIGKDQRPLVASGLIGSFKKVWVDAWSARMEYLLSNALLALLEYPGSTLLGINRMFADKDFRDVVVANVTDPSVKAFWTEEFAKYSDKFATEASAAIQNKVGQFAANPLIRNMMGQPKSSFNIRDIMDKKKIFIANLSKGRIGEGNASLIGGMLITKLYLAAMSRAEMGVDALGQAHPFYLYVDEFQSFANESFADILSEARKYKLSLTIAHQYIEQMSEEVRAAVFGNVGTTISFRVGSFDAEVLEKEFAPQFLAEDLVNLGFAQIYLKLMIDGIGSSPFSATTLNRPPAPAHLMRDEVIASSREQFSKPRAEVEAQIMEWHAPVAKPPRAEKPDRPQGDRPMGDRPPRSHAGSVARSHDGGPMADRPRRPVSQGEGMRRELRPSPSAPQVLDQQPQAQPFKQAFSEVAKVPIEPERPQTPPTQRASLSRLSHENNTKAPSTQNVQSLKDVLASVLAKKEVVTPPIKKEALPSPEVITQVTQGLERANADRPKEPPKQTVSNVSKTIEEVPEDVLRKVLE